jgi:hypothetical protein
MERKDASRHGMRVTGAALVVVFAVVTLLAGCGGGGSPTPTSPTPPVTPPVTPPLPPPVATLMSVAIAPASLVGGNAAQGTVTLSAAAAAGGAVVSLASNSAAAVVPASVTVAAGATTATFAVNTSAVTDARSATITATFNGVNQTATLGVTPVPLIASFTVTSASRGANACAIIDNGNVLDCTFDGSASSGSPSRWVWTYFVGANQGSNNSSDARTRPDAGCNFLRNQNPTTDGAGVQFIQMEVRLKVQDARGIESPEVRNLNVRMFPNLLCGYGF